ncbi:MAG: hypothetical protein HQL99_16750 [Magnetococcales bacterium]|nr:hypothetical protein [Magnetococcales bacterium]
MDALLFFALQIVVSLVISGIVVAMITPVLRPVLEEMCGTSDRAGFWARYTSIVLFLFPLLIVMATADVETSLPLMLVTLLKRVMGGSVCGLLLTLMVLGLRLNRGIPAQK